MKIRVFQSDHGDCLLLTSADGKHLLADGGISDSYTRHVSPTLAKMHKNGESLDLAYVSHIDQDHIGGILQMMDDLLDWNVYDYQQSAGNSAFPKPEVRRPAAVKSIWHNSFHEQLGKNSGAIEDMLAAHAVILSGSGNGDGVQKLAEIIQNLATSKAEAVRLSRRIGAKQLQIPLNKEYNGHLMFVTDPAEQISLGSMKIWIIGPFEEDLRKLRSEWNTWLRENGKRQIKDIRRESREDEELLGWSEIEALIQPLLLQAKRLGRRRKVSPANLASLMLYIEENGKSVLMTGDGHSDDILDGLYACNKLDSQGRIHVDVLKVQHHGSEHNIDKEFCKRVTANHYIFCGNGHSDNPEIDVIDAIAWSRIGSSARRSPNPQSGNKFKLWFNSGKEASHKYKKHMRKVEHRVRYHRNRSSGKLTSKFLRNQHSFAFRP